MDLYYQIIKTIDNNKIYKVKVRYGTPQLSRSKINLYNSIMNFNLYENKDEEKNIMLNILNRLDGKMSLLEFCNKFGYKLLNILDLVKKLVEAGYIFENDKIQK